MRCLHNLIVLAMISGIVLAYPSFGQVTGMTWEQMREKLVVLEKHNKYDYTILSAQCKKLETLNALSPECIAVAEALSIKKRYIIENEIEQDGVNTPSTALLLGDYSNLIRYTAAPFKLISDKVIERSNIQVPRDAYIKYICTVSNEQDAHFKQPYGGSYFNFPVSKNCLPDNNITLSKLSDFVQKNRETAFFIRKDQMKVLVSNEEKWSSFFYHFPIDGPDQKITVKIANTGNNIKILPKEYTSIIGENVLDAVNIIYTNGRAENKFLSEMLTQGKPLRYQLIQLLTHDSKMISPSVCSIRTQFVRPITILASGENFIESTKNLFDIQIRPELQSVLVKKNSVLLDVLDSKGNAAVFRMGGIAGLHLSDTEKDLLNRIVMKATAREIWEEKNASYFEQFGKKLTINESYDGWSKIEHKCGFLVGSELFIESILAELIDGQILSTLQNEKDERKLRFRHVAFVDLSDIDERINAFYATKSLDATEKEFLEKDMMENPEKYAKIEAEKKLKAARKKIEDEVEHYFRADCYFIATGLSTDLSNCFNNGASIFYKNQAGSTARINQSNVKFLESKTFLGERYSLHVTGPSRSTQLIIQIVNGNYKQFSRDIFGSGQSKIYNR